MTSDGILLTMPKGWFSNGVLTDQLMSVEVNSSGDLLPVPARVNQGPDRAGDQ